MKKLLFTLKTKIKLIPNRILAISLSIMIVAMSIPTVYFAEKLNDSNKTANKNSSDPNTSSKSGDETSGNDAIKNLSDELSSFANISDNDEVNKLVKKALNQLSLNKHEDAVKLINSAIKLESDNAKLFLIRAKIYQALENSDLAIKDYEKAIQIDKTMVDAYVALADLYYKDKQQNSALNICNNGLAQEPDNAELLETRMYIYSDSGEYEKAIADAEKIIKLKPTDPLGYAGLADFLVTYNEYDKVIDNYTTALKYCDDDDNDLMYAIYRQRSLCYYNTDKYAMAIGDFKKYYDACKYDGNIIYFALSYYYTQDTENSITWFKRCINNSVEANMASYYLASIYAVKGEYQTALEYYTTSINGKYNKDNSLYNRGVCYKELKNKEKALEDFNTCLKTTKDLTLKQTVENAIKELNK